MMHAHARNLRIISCWSCAHAGEESAMNVRVRRHGGIVGIDEIVANLDTDRLPSAAAGRLRNLVARLTNAIAAKPSTRGADFICYDINVVEDSRTRTMTTCDEGDPADPAMNLVHAITELAD
jgi:hypothetical protein